MNIMAVYSILGAAAALQGLTLCRNCFIDWLMPLAQRQWKSILQVGTPGRACAHCGTPTPLVQRMGPAAQRLRAAAEARAARAEAAYWEAEAGFTEPDGETEARLREQAFRDSPAGWAWEREMREADGPMDSDYSHLLNRRSDPYDDMIAAAEFATAPLD